MADYHPPSKPLYGWGVCQTTHPANLFMGGGWAGPPTQETSPACTDPPSPDPRFLLLFPRFCSPVAGFFFRFFMFPRRVLVHVSDVGLRLVLLFTCCLFRLHTGALRLLIFCFGFSPLPPRFLLVFPILDCAFLLSACQFCSPFFMLLRQVLLHAPTVRRRHVRACATLCGLGASSWARPPHTVALLRFGCRPCV